MFKTISLSIVLLMSTNLLSAQKLTLPLLFNDHMVLQRDADVRFWGWAKAGNEVDVTFDDINRKTVADDEGYWETYLPAQEAGGPHSISVSSAEEEISLSDVFFGDVWLAGGQSNMEWKLSWEVENGEEEIAHSDDFPEIRFFEVPKQVAHAPQDQLTGGEWKIAHPDNAGNFSAVAWHFAKLNHLEKGVPVGIVESNLGGTPAEAWTPATRLLDVEGYKESASEVLDSINYWKQELAENERKGAEKEKLIGNPQIGEEKGVHQKEYDDSDWETITLPLQKPLTDVVWLRKTFTVGEDKIESARLFSGDIIQEAFLYLNGEKIGEKVWRHNDIKIEVEPSLLNPGENTIAIRVTNSWINNVMIGGEENNVSISINGEHKDLTGDWKYSNQAEPSIPSVTRYTYVPGFLYNAMIHPIAGFTIKGCIWYQGESNAGKHQYYNELFEEMIEAWREEWNQGDFPFLFVQLANYMQKKEQPVDSDWARLREAQTEALSLNNTGMAVTIDIGDADDIHPRNKKDVGKRLWLSAEKEAFGEQLVHSGPMYRGHVIEGNKIRLSFNHIGSGLVSKNYDDLVGFAIAGEDQKFYWPKAEIDGGNVVVWSDKVENPVAVKYGWADNPDVSLYNEDGLPAVPFRTDEW